jgi:hypothetical protein
MWSLPNIKAMNAQAAAQASKLRRAARRGPGKRQKCEYYGCEERAVESAPWFDIFSEDPKGLVHVCAGHNPWDVEGFFLCDECQRVICDHITWERYQVELDGRVLCLACAAEEYFQDPANWINPKLVKEVGLSRNGAPLFDRETGFLNVAGVATSWVSNSPSPPASSLPTMRSLTVLTAIKSVATGCLIL